LHSFERTSNLAWFQLDTGIAFNRLRAFKARDNARVLRGGKTIRVSLMMADAARGKATQRLHDGYGGLVGGKPGFIVSDASQVIRNEAYCQSVFDLNNAWRSTRDGAPSTDPGPMSAADAVRTDMATLMARLNDARRTAYDAYVDELSNAWRRT
jgi:hypothetical protein